MQACKQYPETESLRMKQMQIIDMLMKEAGMQAYDGYTAMMYACGCLNVDAVKRLCIYEAGRVNKDEETALIIACKRNAEQHDEAERK